MSKKVLIIGAGGVGSVVAQKCGQVPEVFGEICLASRTKSKCDAIAKLIPRPIQTAQVDADQVPEMVALIRDFQPDLVLNVALPYQDLTIMDACLETGVNYLDTANYEPLDEAKFEYKWQWAYQERFKRAGLMALLGSGFDPGVTNVFCAYAQKHLFDTIKTIDILDCNAGSHGHAFATNFNPEINIREITQRGRYWEKGQWLETDPLSKRIDFDYPIAGVKPSYLLYHEELESLVLNIKGLERIRFWMTFSDNYLKHLEVYAEHRYDPHRPGGVRGPPDRADPVPQSPVARPGLAGRQLHRQDRDRLHLWRREGRQACAEVHLQRLRPRRMLPGGQLPGHLLHHRGAGDDRRQADADRGLAGRGGLQHGADGSRSLHGGTEHPRTTLAGGRFRWQPLG